jgi:hypothetical protein
MTWHVSDDIIRLRDPKYPFGVTVQPPFRHHDTSRQEVLDWCTANCEQPALVCGYELVGFQNEGDAVLFYLAFKD